MEQASRLRFFREGFSERYNRCDTSWEGRRYDYHCMLLCVGVLSDQLSLEPLPAFEDYRQGRNGQRVLWWILAPLARRLRRDTDIVPFVLFMLYVLLIFFLLTLILCIWAFSLSCVLAKCSLNILSKLSISCDGFGGSILQSVKLPSSRPRELLDRMVCKSRLVHSRLLRTHCRHLLIACPTSSLTKPRS